MKINTNNGEKLIKMSTPVCDKQTYIKSTIFCDISSFVGIFVSGWVFLGVPLLIACGMWSLIAQKFDAFWTIMIFASTYTCLMFIYIYVMITIFDLIFEKVFCKIDAMICKLININMYVGLKHKSDVAIRNT